MPRRAGHEQRALGLVCRGAGIDGLPGFRHGALSVAAANAMRKGIHRVHEFKVRNISGRMLSRAMRSPAESK
jgi:hypothetical protein